MGINSIFKEKAKELFDKFSPYSNGYVGSSFINNIEYENIIKMNTKEMCIIAIDNVIDAFDTYANDLYFEIDYWNNVKNEIEKL